jgi:Xaa-Pro aminopeptidase
MVVSNEPGLYIDGSYGIRIENLCQVVEDNSPQALSSEYGPFYKFENLTLVPYCKQLIDVSLLDVNEIEQIKQYYQAIENALSLSLSGSELIWLQNQLNFLN